MTKIAQICYHLPDLDVTEITSWNSIPMGLTANDMAAQYPNMFWIEADDAGQEHLCCNTICGEEYPKIDTSVGVFRPLNFVFVPTMDKQEGDRNWRPSTKPPRPLV